LKISIKKKADKYSAERGIIAAAHYFSPDSTLKDTTVHSWKVKYLCELRKRKCDGKDLVVKSLPVTKM